MSQVAVKDKLTSLCDKVVNTGEKVIFQHRGKKFALISFEDYKFFRELEDLNDNLLADAVLAKTKDNEEKPIPWEDIKKKYEFRE